MKRILIFIVMIFLNGVLFSAEENLVKSILNKEIIISDNWAGQSMTLIKEQNDYFIIRKIFGSGVPVVSEMRYKVKIESTSQLRFSELIVNEEDSNYAKVQEQFIMQISQNNTVKLFLNGLEVVVLKIGE